MRTNDADILLDLLLRLTTAGRAEWLRCEEPGYLFCFVGNERLDVVIHGDEEQAIAPETPDVAAVVVSWRHRKFLFLQPDIMHPGLLDLLCRARLDEAGRRLLNLHARARDLEALRFYLTSQSS